MTRIIRETNVQTVSDIKSRPWSPISGPGSCSWFPDPGSLMLDLGLWILDLGSNISGHWSRVLVHSVSVTKICYKV